VRRWRAFSLLAVAYFMTIMDLTIVNVALPTIGRKLHFPQSDLQWVVTAYALTFGGFLLFGGRTADLLGRRRLFMAGLGVFTGASLGCALATSDTFLIIMRGIQGLGAAAVLPAALSIVVNTFGEGAERNRALGIWGGIGATAATAGLLAGGVLTRYAGWEYIFVFNVPIGAAALLLARRVVPESRLHAARRRYDPLGAGTVTGALVALVYAISQAPTAGRRPRHVPAHPAHRTRPGRRGLPATRALGSCRRLISVRCQGEHDEIPDRGSRRRSGDPAGSARYGLRLVAASPAAARRPPKALGTVRQGPRRRRAPAPEHRARGGPPPADLSARCLSASRSSIICIA
jgi:MFS family permease